MLQTQVVWPKRPGSTGVLNILKVCSSEPNSKSWVDKHLLGFIIAMNLVDKQWRKH